MSHLARAPEWLFLPRDFVKCVRASDFPTEFERVNRAREGTPGLGKRLLLEKISAFLNEEGFSVTEPTKHEEVGSWFIEILDFEDTS